MNNNTTHLSSQVYTLCGFFYTFLLHILLLLGYTQASHECFSRPIQKENAMILQTKINTQSTDFKQNFQSMKEKVDRLKKEIQLSQALTNQPLSTKKNSKYTALERIEKLKDPNSCFLEFSPLAGQGLYKENLPSAGIVTGIALIQARPCMVIANDWRVKGGTYFPITIKKHLRAQEIALENHLPCIYLVDSGGAYLPYQEEVFPDKNHFGRIFYNQARLTAKGIAQISVVLGHCTAGGAYVPAMSDENIIVRGQGAVFLGGPPLVESATGEKVHAEELGGADLHTSQSGLCDHVAEKEDQALKKARDMVTHLNPASKRAIPKGDVTAPLYPAEEMYGIVPNNLKTAFDMRELLSRLVDGSEFHEFKENYGQTLVTGWARLCGHPVGIVANNGVLFGDSALKGAHFIDICDKRGQALIFLQNIVGFMVGRQYESTGIAKQGAQMVTALSLARVPKFTVIIGSSYGAGNYAMCGRAYQPRQLWMWPSARIAVMGGEQAEKVIQTIKSKSHKKQKLDSKAIKSLSLSEQYARQSSAYYSTSRLWDDGLIDPADTRKVLALGLSASLYAPLPLPLKGIYRF